MNSTELRVAFRESGVRSEIIPDTIICEVLQGLRRYLDSVVEEQKGIVGFIAKIGIRRVIALIDDYIRTTCG